MRGINDKKELIRQFEESAGAFDYVLELPEDLIHFTPFDDAWSIKEQVVHCLDFDIANFHRYRWAIAYPGTEVLSFDASWAGKLDYQSYDLKATLEIIKMIRRYISAHLYSIVEENWEQYHYRFSDGNSINLSDALRHYVEHVSFHQKLIERNIKMFNDKA